MKKKADKEKKDKEDERKRLETEKKAEDKKHDEKKRKADDMDGKENDKKIFDLINFVILTVHHIVKTWRRICRWFGLKRILARTAAISIASATTSTTTLFHTLQTKGDGHRHFVVYSSCLEVVKRHSQLGLRPGDSLVFLRNICLLAFVIFLFLK
jgi:hypothetical protein